MLKYLPHTFILLALMFTSTACSNVYLAENDLKRGMSFSEVADVMGQPTDVEEHAGGREDWIYIGGMCDDFRNVRVIFYNGKYVRWRPAGYNSAGAASFSRALESNANINNQTMQNINATNTNAQLNQINQNLNSINSTLSRGY